jgi:hypothetical protein
MPLTDAIFAAAVAAVTCFLGIGVVIDGTVPFINRVSGATIEGIVPYIILTLPIYNEI